MKKIQNRLKVVPLLLMVSTKPKSLRLNKREGDNKVIRTQIKTFWLHFGDLLMLLTFIVFIYLYIYIKIYAIFFIYG